MRSSKWPTVPTIGWLVRREFSYRRFVKLIDDTIIRKATALGVALRPPYKQKDFVDADTDPAELGSLRELPTMAPHHPAVFLYKKRDPICRLTIK